MIYMRGQARDYDHWRQLGNAGWGWDDVLPYFRQHEDFVHGADDLHGAGGEWRVEEQRLHWPILDAVPRRRREQSAFPRVDDFNRGDNRGHRLFRGQSAARRALVSAAKAFLRPARKRPEPAVVTARAGQARCCSRAAAPSA